MSKFTGAYITNTGKEMLFGSKNLTYTKVILYDQDLSQTAIDQVRALTSLDNPLLTTQIGLADTKSDQVIVEATFKNDRVNQDINFKSVGWYAKTDTRPESLIAVSVIDGVKTLGANSPDQVSTSYINLKLAMAIDDATTVTTQINPANTITPAQLDSAVSNAKQELNASLKAQADKANSELTSANNELTKKLNKAIDDTNASLTTKANASDLSALQNSALQLINGNSGDDILSFRDEKIRRYSNVSNVKNLPSMANSSWFYVVTHTSQGWGNVTVISQDNCYWQNSLNGNAWTGWVKHTTSTDVTNLQNQINAKLNFVRQDAATAIVHDFPTNINDLDKLPEGRYNTRNLSPDAWNAIKNRPDIDKYGMIICYREEADGWQLAFSTNHPTTMYFRGAGRATYSPWQKLEQVDVSGLLAKITDAKNTATQASQKADNANNNANGRLTLSGGNMNLKSVINWNGGGINDRIGNLGGISWYGGTDHARIYGDQDRNDNLDLAFDLGDDGSNHFSFRKNGKEIAMIGLNGRFTGTVDWDHINGKPDLQNQINDLRNQINQLKSTIPQIRRFNN